MPFRILGISGSARRAATNTAMLRGMAAITPVHVELIVYDKISALPIFSPDLEARTPAAVEMLIEQIERCDGILIASPEYVRSMPGGLKNALDWLVSREVMMQKPIALVHASHRGLDMLTDLRRVLATLSARFSPDIFLQCSFIGLTVQEVEQSVQSADKALEVERFLSLFEAFCHASAPT